MSFIIQFTVEESSNAKDFTGKLFTIRVIDDAVAIL